MPSVIREERSEISQIIKSVADRIPKQDMARERFDNLDIARGIAISLMFLSHTVMSLNTYRTLPNYGLMPIHTLTKFSSSLFILVFGVTLAMIYVPAVGTEKWSQRRNRLLWRSMMVLVWYKILTVVQMFHTYPKSMVMATLKFERFTDFVEVLNFYWLAMLWIVLLIPLWARMHWAAQLSLVFALAVTGTLLQNHFDFWGIWQLKAMFVEYRGTFCYGQFQRGALALFGMFLGGIFLSYNSGPTKRLELSIACILVASLFAAIFLYLTQESTETRFLVLKAISKNFGKHPPNFHFTAFSLAGAFSILGICLLLPNILCKALKPFALIGKEAFFSFNLHILIIFLIFRYAFDLRLKLTYPQTLWLFAIVFVSAAALSPLNTYIKKRGVLWKWLLP